MSLVLWQVVHHLHQLRLCQIGTLSRLCTVNELVFFSRHYLRQCLKKLCIPVQRVSCLCLEDARSWCLLSCLDHAIPTKLQSSSSPVCLLIFLISSSSTAQSPQLLILLPRLMQARHTALLSKRTVSFLSLTYFWRACT